MFLNHTHLSEHALRLSDRKGLTETDQGRTLSAKRCKDPTKSWALHLVRKENVLYVRRRLNVKAVRGCLIVPGNNFDSSNCGVR